MRRPEDNRVNAVCTSDCEVLNALCAASEGMFVLITCPITQLLKVFAPGGCPLGELVPDDHLQTISGGQAACFIGISGPSPENFRFFYNYF